MKLASLHHMYSRLLSGRFLTTLALAALTLQNGWAAPIAQQAYLKASNTGGAPSFDQPGDNFGFCVALSGNTMVVGALGEASRATGVSGNQSDNSATDSGAAYVFVRSGTNWIQQVCLKASNTGANDHFGHSVAVSGDTVVVGAEQESSNATGVDGNQSDKSALNSGAAYVFARSGTNWTQQAYLKASNTREGDSFGYSGAVAVSGDTVAVGAPFEDSNATGVNGDQANNSATDSGAVYVFTGLNSLNRLTLVADGGGYLIRFDGSPKLTYRLQRASSLTGPWDTIGTQTAAASGLIEYRDPLPLAQDAFYRAVMQ